MKHRYLGLAVAFVAIAALTFIACGGGNDTGTSPSVNFTPTSSTTSSNGQPAEAPPAQTPTTNPPVTGIAVELVSTDFAADRCTKLQDPKYAGVTQLVEVAKVTNGTSREVYPFPAIFHSKKAGCGATDENPGGTLNLVSGINIQPGGAEVWTHTFNVPGSRDFCGRYQFDNDARNGEIVKSTLRGGIGGYVIDTGVDCPECSATNVQVSISGEGLTRTVKVTFQGEKPGKKATVDFGDGTSAQVGNGGSVQHTWAYGSFTVTASLDVDGLDLPCTANAVVENRNPCDQSSLQVQVKVDGQGRLGYKVISTQPGTLHILGQDIQFSAGTTGPTIITSEPECGKLIEWTAETQCNQAGGSVRTESCCEEAWVAQEPVRENEGAYGECHAPNGPNFAANSFNNNPPQGECDGVKTRTYDEVVYEVNSCTEQRREKSRVQKTEDAPCTYACLAALCHTENKQYCGVGLYKDRGEWKFGYHCENSWFLGADKKWQCQNVPPGTPGHWDNHFDKNGHEDFFGSCGPVGGTSEKCYSITN